MRNNLRKIYEKMKAMDKRNASQESMVSMLKELTEHSFKGYAGAEEQIVLFDYSAERFNGRVEFEFHSERGYMLAQLYFPINCCRENRRKVADLFHMINCSTVQGVFECDPRSGACRFKYVHYYGDQAMTQKQARQAVGILISSLRQYEKTIVPLLLGYEPKAEDACEEYGMLSAEGTDVGSSAAAIENDAAEQQNEARTQEESTEQSEPTRSERNASQPTEPPKKDLNFEVDNDEMLRLFNDACSEAEARRRGREVTPVEGSEADEVRDTGGIPVEPVEADDVQLEPGQLGITLNDLGEMVSLVTGGAALCEDDEDSQEQADIPSVIEVEAEDIQDAEEAQDAEDEEENSENAEADDERGEEACE